jgi:hypothetical protein
MFVAVGGEIIIEYIASIELLPTLVVSGINSLGNAARSLPVDLDIFFAAAIGD